MSSSFDNQKRRSRSRSPVHDYAKQSLLAKVKKSELNNIRVAIKRSNVVAKGKSEPIERGIIDPSKICDLVHIRKSNIPPIHVPIFGKGIKVNQDFTEDRTVFTNERLTRRSRSRDRSHHDHRRSYSRDRSGHDKRAKSRDRTRSRSRERGKRSRDRIRRSISRTRSISRQRSRSRDRKYSPEKHRYREDSRERHRRSRSRPTSPSHYESSSSRERRRRSITPLRPGEYRPGHPDLAKRKAVDRCVKNDRNLSVPVDMHNSGKHMEEYMAHGFYPAPFLPIMGMPPFRPGFPMGHPYYRYPGPMHMMPRMPRHQFGPYNHRTITPKPTATITSVEEPKEKAIEQPSQEADHSEAVSSSDKQGH